MLQLKLGAAVKDRITGYEGIVTGFAEYITGCRQWLVTSRALKPDGETLANWIDEVRLELTRKKSPMSVVAAFGGPPLGPKSATPSPPKGRP